MRGYEIKSSFWYVYKYTTHTTEKNQEITDNTIYQNKILDGENVDIIRGLMA